MKTSVIFQGMLTEVDKLLRIYFSVPVTSATAERLFSCLRRIKTYLRSTMTDNWLNNLFLLHIHSKRTERTQAPTLTLIHTQTGKEACAHRHNVDSGKMRLYIIVICWYMYNVSVYQK